MPLNWGLIGASTIARQWMVDAIRSQPDCSIAGIASADPARAAKFASELALPKAYRSVEELIADPAIDVVYISTTNQHHEPQTLAAAAAGKHVLCEKPLSLSLGGARGMVDACAKAGVVMGTNHHLRNAITHRRMRELIANGAIGAPLAVRVFHAVFLPEFLQGWRIDSAESGGGVILDITVHDADTLRFLLDDEPIEVTALTASQGMGKAGIADSVMGVMRFANGTLAQFHDAFTIAHTSTGIEIHGTDGSLIGRNVMTQAPIGEVVLRRGQTEETVDLGEHNNLYVRSVRNFTDAVLGKGSPSASGHDGVRSLAIALAVAESAATGSRVNVAD